MRQLSLPGQDGVVAEFEQHAQLLVEECVIVRRAVAKQRIGLDEGARGRNDLARPSEIRSKVANCSKSRTGSWVDSTVTAVLSRGLWFPGRWLPGRFPGRKARNRAGDAPQAQKAEAGLVRQLGQLNDLSAAAGVTARCRC